MDESLIAREILDAVLWRAAEERAAHVRLVRGWVADVGEPSLEQVASHFAARAFGTAAAGARLELRVIRAETRCSSCGRGYVPEGHVPRCPACGGTDAAQGQGGIGLEGLEVE